jgi:hypothetical protein
MPTDDFQTEPPQPPVPPRAGPFSRWPAWVVNIIGWVLGLAIVMVMLFIILSVFFWLFGPKTIGTPATPP